MQARPVIEFITLLERSSWHVQLGEPKCCLSDHLTKSGFAEFVRMVRSAESPRGRIWFLGSSDYCDDSGEGWNFIEESLSIPAADGNSKWISEIRDFWSSHVPIAIRASGDYSYLAIDRIGQVVTGCAPLFEETQVVASSFEQLIEIMGDGASRLAQEWLSDLDDKVN